MCERNKGWPFTKANLGLEMDVTTGFSPKGLGRSTMFEPRTRYLI